MTVDPNDRSAAPGSAAARLDVHFELNGSAVALTVQPSDIVCDVLRDQLDLTGTKFGCRIGVCGLCTVLLDGLPASSCLLLAPMLEGRRLTTIEGLGSDGRLDPVQAAFAEEQGFQCGICTPGQVLAARALLELEPDPDEPRIRDWMTGNLCRCTGYASIVRSIQAAARRLAEPGQPDRSA
jgi:aerobic-type carbon monoxide dehydrogenase small subunit (CoxS/CutS family)